MFAVVAVNHKWAIGNEGKLLYDVREDKTIFKILTHNKTIVYGANTLDTFPNGLPLEGRHNVILSKNRHHALREKLEGYDVEVFESIDEFLEHYDVTEDNIVLVGGGKIYDELLKYCDHVFVTMFDDFRIGDTYFPNLDKSDNWEEDANGAHAMKILMSSVPNEVVKHLSTLDPSQRWLIGRMDNANGIRIRFRFIKYNRVSTDE